MTQLSADQAKKMVLEAEPSASCWAGWGDDPQWFTIWVGLKDHGEKLGEGSTEDAAWISAASSLPKEDGKQELLTGDQVLSEMDEFIATKGNPILAAPIRTYFERNGYFPFAVLADLNIEQVTMWRRKAEAKR